MQASQFFRRFEGAQFFWQTRQARRGEGGRASSLLGGAGDFSDHRAYEPGDDARAVDWPAYGRTGRLLTKLRQAESMLAVRVLIDVSASMQAGEGRVGTVAQQAAEAAGALAASLVVSGDAARVEFFGQRLYAGSGWIYRRDRVAELWEMARRGAADRSGETSNWTALPSQLHGGTAASGSPAPVVIFSDFWGDAVIDVLRRLSAGGQEILAVQILTSAERQPPWRGGVRLQDAETGDIVRLDLDGGKVSAYRQRLEERVLALQTACRLGGGDAIMISPSYSWQDAVLACWRKRGRVR